MINWIFEHKVKVSIYVRADQNIHTGCKFSLNDLEFEKHSLIQKYLAWNPNNVVIIVFLFNVDFQILRRSIETLKTDSNLHEHPQAAVSL